MGDRIQLYIRTIFFLITEAQTDVVHSHYVQLWKETISKCIQHK